MTHTRTLSGTDAALVRDALAPLTDSLQRFGRHIAAELDRVHAAASTDALQDPRSRDARRTGLGHSRRGVLIGHTTRSLRDAGRTFTADTVALAARGDRESVDVIHAAAADGQRWALAVIAALRLADSDTDATSWADELADDDTDTVTVAALVHDADAPPPTPRVTLTGSVDVCAPPARTLHSRSVQASGSHPREDAAQT